MPKSSSAIAELWIQINIPMKPARVSARRDKEHRLRPAFLVAFFYPSAHLGVGWITENSVACPRLNESVILLGEILPALGALFCSAGIKGEVEERIEFIEEILRRAPIVGLSAE